MKLKPLLPTLGLMLPLSLFATQSQAADVRIYNWFDYTPQSTLDSFQAATGIRPTLDTFDSNEVLEARLMSGRSGYDVVVPSDSFLAKQRQAGAFQKLDKSLLPNLGNLNPDLMQALEGNDPGNEYAVPYMWGTNGIGFNVDKVRAVLGEDAPVDSWALVFDPTYMAKLAQCGVAFLDSPSEILPAALHYLGRDPNSTEADDYAAAEELMLAIQPYVRYFHSSRFLNDLANGEICVAVAWSGSILQADARAQEAGNGVQLEYRIPKEGTQVWFDLMAIPRDAPNPAGAHAFINHILEPEVVAAISNEVGYANPNQAATPLVKESLRTNPGAYPPAQVQARLFTLKPLPIAAERIRTRAWNRIKTGK
ncbi:polyamine ABC transporter substrate-binding protein [Pseudomonas jilinensis]